MVVDQSSSRVLQSSRMPQPHAIGLGAEGEYVQATILCLSDPTHRFSLDLAGDGKFLTVRFGHGAARLGHVVRGARRANPAQYTIS